MGAVCLLVAAIAAAVVAAGRGNDELSTDFQKEVATLWSIRHTNLQRLLGYCWEQHDTALDPDSPAVAAAAGAAGARVGADSAKILSADADAAGGYEVEQAEEQVLVFEWVPGGNLQSRIVAAAYRTIFAQHLVSRNITANLRAAHLPEASDAIVLPMVRLALSCTASNPLSRPTVTDLLRSIKALKRSLSAHPRPALPVNAGKSRNGDMPNVTGRGGDGAETLLDYLV
ncbi:unnamed protein product [Closterium sp. Naga37s-1]|nr:unnamed protein product [Closterium sp. Naga37s-1]